MKIAKTYKDEGVGPTKHGLLNEQDLIDCGMKQHLMTGTGWLTSNSCRDAVFYYEIGRITINATEIAWTWFLDGEMRNDIEVYDIDSLKKLILKYKQ